MFGLMRFQWTHLVSQNYVDYRLHYCGVCKSIGSLYNHESRWFLNRDIVFLADLIQKIDSKNTLKNNESFQSQNCFVLPKKEDIPQSLQFFSAINLVLGHYKLLDNIIDEKGWLSRSSQALLDRFKIQFLTAENNLKTLGFNLNIVQELIENQKLIEQKPQLDLDAYSENTSLISGCVASYSFELINQSELSSLGKQLGNLFGKLVYIVDAIEDIKSDFKKKRFNAIVASFQLTTPSLNSKQKHYLKTYITNLTTSLKDVLGSLLKNQSDLIEIVFRLDDNVSKTLSKFDRLPRDKFDLTVLIKRTYFKIITRVSFLGGLLLYAILPQKTFYNSKLVNDVFKIVSKDRTQYFLNKKK